MPFPFRSNMRLRRFIHGSLIPVGTFLLASLLLTGCVDAVGDRCNTSQDCPTNAICDSTAPQGYCTIPDCTVGSCPDKSICVEFDRETAFCMKFCEDNNDCRNGYVCRDEPNSRAFCYVAP